jgi:hypothetical protein
MLDCTKEYADLTIRNINCQIFFFFATVIGISCLHSESHLIATSVSEMLSMIIHSSNNY